MATRSTIALEYADGQVDQVYCHWDGYLSNNGEILIKHYQDPFKVQQLMALGDLSSLRKDIGEKHDFDARYESGDSREDWTVAYGRDRGEAGIDARRFKDYQDYVDNHQYEEYEYILRTDGNWYVCQYGKGYELLSDALAHETIEALVAEDE